MSDLKQAQIDLRVLAAVSAFASNEETRYYLNGVCLEISARQTVYVATDGHPLIAYRKVLDKDEPDNTLTGNFIVPTATCRATRLGKKLHLGTLQGRDGEKSMSLVYLDSGITFKPIDGTFPDWRRVWPVKAASGVAGHFNFVYMASFAKFAETLGICNPKLMFDGPENPTRVDFGDENVGGVIMPWRVGRAEKFPDWINGPIQHPAKIEPDLAQAA